jgi:hypothetical protein
MESTLDINQIVSEIERLDYSDKINILSRIVNLLRKEDSSHQVYPVTSLKGLGKSIWQKNDTDSYLSGERESWD